jgi:hypothetical protein
MASRGRKHKKDWLTDPEGEIPVINSALYRDKHFTWTLLPIRTDNTPRLCLIRCNHCEDYNKKVMATRYNNTSNLIDHLRYKHQEEGIRVDNEISRPRVS